MLTYCQEHHITIIAYTPLEDGSLATPSRFFPDRRLKILEQMSTQTNRTMAQVALNWCTSRPNVIVIPKSNSIARTEENCTASGWRLSPAEVRILDEAFD